MDQEIAAHLDVLKATPTRLAELLRKLPRSLAATRPAPGKWSIHEIVCHMRDMERDAYQARYQRILAEDDPALPDIDGDRLALESDYRSLKLAEVVRDWKKLRKENLALLEKVKGNAWERRGVHATAGPLTMATLVRRHAVGNDAAHLGQIEAIQARFGTLAALNGATRELRDAFRRVPTYAVAKRTADGKWAPIEHACHLRDIEQVFVDRFTKAAHQDRPSFWMPDNDRLVERLSYATADPEKVVKEFEARRKDTLALLGALPPSTWRRTGLHPKRGEMSIEELAKLLVGHDAAHIARIREAADRELSA